SFVFTASATNHFYILSLPDALPIYVHSIEICIEAEPGVQSEYSPCLLNCFPNTFPFADRTGHGYFAPNIFAGPCGICRHDAMPVDRKSTRLNSSHVKISYAVFCLKK